MPDDEDIIAEEATDVNENVGQDKLKEDECIACSSEDLIIYENCRHSVFCTPCAKKWFRTSPTCPMCRGIVNNIEVNQIMPSQFRHSIYN